MFPEASNPIDLWTCLHDGVLKAVRSDLMARTLTFVIDSSFHWEFNNLPAETRFELIGERVRSTQALSFEPWPGAVEPPREMPWHEAQEIRLRDEKFGRLISSDWERFASQIGTNEELIVMRAELANENPNFILRLEIIGYPSSHTVQIEIRAENFRFSVGDRKLSTLELTQFGDAYWNDFSKRSKELSS